MDIKASFREGTTNKNFLRRSLDACAVGELIAERATDPDVQLDQVSDISRLAGQVLRLCDRR